MCVEGEAGEVMCNVKDFGLSRVFLKRPDARKWYRVLLEEVRVHQSRKLKRSAHLHGFLDLVYGQNIHSFSCPSSPQTAPSSVIEHLACSPAAYCSSVDVVVGPGGNMGAFPFGQGNLTTQRGKRPHVKSSSMRNRQWAAGLAIFAPWRRARVSLWSGSVSVSCPHGRTFP